MGSARLTNTTNSVLNPAAPKLEREGESEEAPVAFEGAEPVEGEKEEEKEGEGGGEGKPNSAASYSLGLPTYSILSILAGAAIVANL